jgi:FkbH-like protein
LTGAGASIRESISPATGCNNVNRSPNDALSLELRDSIDRSILNSAIAEADLQLRKLWEIDPSSSTANFLVSRYESLRPHLRLVPHRVAILRSFTVEPVVPLLRAGAFAASLDLDIHVGDFGAYVQEMLDPSSAIYRFKPDTVFLAVGTEDIAPELWSRYADLSSSDVLSVVDRLVADYREWVTAFRRCTKANLVLHTLECPAASPLGILDNQRVESQGEAIGEINRQIRALAAEHAGVVAFDYDGLVAAHGRLSWRDQKKQLAVRMPIAAGHLRHLAADWLRILQPLAGRVAKVLVTDLDNTLWGGVLGEDGPAGIRLGLERPGIEYLRLQRALLDLSRRGILLAISSKNNANEALEMIDRHPAMLLRRQNFSAIRINWDDKATHLREIAAELNVGLDAVAFLDDNPAERDRVRSELPEVFVLDLPSDVMGFARTLTQNPIFERLKLSSEDLQRGRYYGEQRERTVLERSATTPEEFYRSLRQEVEVGRVSPATLARVAQLTQKTNQFNLTTRRYTEQQLVALIDDPAWSLFFARVLDRYGDNGIVAVGLLHYSDGECEIDTLLLSCRVIGRTVETAFLARLLRDCRERSATALRGWFLPTQKNAPARDFYRNHGFEMASEDDRGTLWRLDAGAGVTVPDWISMTDAEA